ncbi:MAG: energy transducer TonB [Bacteroidota bacterium]
MDLSVREFFHLPNSKKEGIAPVRDIGLYLWQKIQIFWSKVKHMLLRCIRFILSSGLFLFLIFGAGISTTGLGQKLSNEVEYLDFMDAETFYSFKGLDGKGFLRRSPVNLPQPLFEGQETGLVALVFTITPSGQISQVRPEKSEFMSATQKMLDAATTAVKQWKFNPLPPAASQSDEEVRVVVQFNHKESGVLYSIDGQFTIEGLAAGRKPVKLVRPKYDSDHQGVVTVLATINPLGGLAWIDKFYALNESQKVVPRLGIITDQAIRRWRFTPLTEDSEQLDQQIKITCRYFRWND